MLIQCRICGLSLCEINWSHLRSHNMTVLEYQDKFPDAPLVPQELASRRGLSISETMRSKPRKLSSEHLKALQAGHRTFLSDPDKYKRFCSRCSEIPRDYMKTETYRKLRSEITKEVFKDPEVRRRHAEGVSRGNRGRSFSEEHKEALSKSLRKVYMEGRGGWQNWSEEAIDRRNKAISKGQKAFWSNPSNKDRMVKLLFGSQGKVPSGYEKSLHLCLDKNFPNEWLYNGDLSEGFTVGGRIPDFIRNDGQKYLIELFGCTFHHSLIPEDRGSEEETISHYAKFNYKCLVIWGYELPDETYIVSKVREFINGKSG